MSGFRHLCVALFCVASHAASNHHSSTDLEDQYVTCNKTYETAAGYESGFAPSLASSFSSFWTPAKDGRAAHSEISRSELMVPTSHVTDATKLGLAARQEVPVTSSNCVPVTAESVTATCTPLAGKGTGEICRERSTVTVTGCDVVDATSSTTIASTITAYCDSNGGCGGAPCQAKYQPTVQPTCETCSPAETGFSKRIDSAWDLGSLVQKRAPDDEDPEEPEGPGPLEDVSSYKNYNEFLVKESDKTLPANNVPHLIGTSSIARRFGKNQFNAGVRNLYGCTSVIAVSRRGALVSHIWEVPTFSDGESGKPSEDEWMKGAQQGIFTGDGTYGHPGLNMFTAEDPKNSLFDRMKYGKTINSVAIYVVTPAREDQPLGVMTERSWFRDCKYQTEIMTLYYALRDTYTNVKVATYSDKHGREDTPERDADMAATGKGRAFLQYTPRSNKKPEKQVPKEGEAGSSSDTTPPTCEPQKAMVRLWIHGNPAEEGGQFRPVFEDTWDALPEQIIEPPEKKDEGQKKVLDPREDASVPGDSCVWFGDETSSTTQSPVTSCALHTNVATVPGITTITAGMRCDCNNNILAAVNSVTGANGVISYFCDLGTATSFLASRSTPPVTLTGDLTCQLTSTVAASSTIEYCTCNDYQVHGAYTNEGDQGGATVMCNPKDPQGSPITATFTTTGHQPFKTGVCRVELHETSSGTLKDPKMPLVKPVTVRVRTYDAAGILVTDDTAVNLESPDVMTTKPNLGMGYASLLNVYSSNDKGNHPSFLNHGWVFHSFDRSSTTLDGIYWSTADDETKQAKNYPRCGTGEWSEDGGNISRDVQCWWICD